MSGALAMGTNKITGVGDGTDAQDAVTKTQLDTKQATIDSSARLDASLIGSNGDVSNSESWNEERWAEDFPSDRYLAFEDSRGGPTAAAEERQQAAGERCK